jgi:hypothetical protein
MQLKVQRDQQQKGLISKRTVYSLNVRVEYSDEEREAINSKKLGGSMLFEHEKTKITVRSLKDGHHLESEDLAFITDVEQKVREALKNLKTHIQVAAAFDGKAEVEEI